MTNILHNILIATVVLSLTCTPVVVNAMPEPAPPTQTDKQKAAEAKRKEAEKKKKEAEKAKAAKEKAKAAAAKKKEADKQKAERAKVAAEREQAKAKKEAEAKALEEKQLRDYEKYQQSLENPKTEVISYVALGLRAGYAAMMDKIAPTSEGALWGAGTLNKSNALQQLIGGPGAGLDLTYNLEYGHFLFETGLDFRFLNSTSGYGFNALQVEKNTGAKYYYLFDNMHETRNLMQIGVPIMFGAQFNNFYFLLGTKIGYSLWSSYSQAGKYDIVVDDPIYKQPYGMGIHKLNGQTVAPITFRQPEVSLAAEVGIDLDKWLQKQPKERDPKDKRKIEPGQRLPFGREHVHYRLGFFAEYGILNTNGTPATNQFAFAAGDPHIQQSNTMLALNGDTKLNNLFVGARFTIQFEIPGKTARPVPPPASYAQYSIVDAETNEPIKIAFVETRATESGKIAMREKQIGPKGFRQKHALGSFTVEVKAEGYVPVTQTFIIDKVGATENVTIALQPRPVPPPLDTVVEVKTGDVFIVHNLHFATNKTRILPSSEQALNDLYNYLAQHAELRIRIIGHTDNVGNDASNQKLSEGRAEAVKKELVERGLNADRIETEGRGESQPIDTNDTDEGRQKNRRVEIEIL